jgi:hypothetical protein
MPLTPALSPHCAEREGSPREGGGRHQSGGVFAVYSSAQKVPPW